MSEKQNESQKSLISIILDNKKGMLAKIAQFFADNNMNIESLTMAVADVDKKIQRVVAYVTGNRERVGGLCKEMAKIEGIHKVSNFMANTFFEKELGLIKFKVTNPMMQQITDLVNQHNGETIYVDDKIVICEVEEIEEKVDEFMRKAQNISGEIEMLRTGIVATSLSDEI